MTALGRLLAREPVLAGAAILAWVAVLSPSEQVMAAAVASVAVVMRWLSTPTSAAKDQVTAAVEHKEATITSYLQGAQDAAPPPAKVAAKKVAKAAKR